MQEVQKIILGIGNNISSIEVPKGILYTFTNGKQGGKIIDSGIEFSPRNWDMYKDKELDKKQYIKQVYIMTTNEINYQQVSKNGIGSPYWLASISTRNYFGIHYYLKQVDGSGELSGSYDYITGCYGIRPIVEFNDGVYIMSGSGIESDPYVLGKE